MDQDDIIDDADLMALPIPSVSARSEQPQPQPPANAAPRKIQQPKPQSLGARASASAILVSPRQKGNPVLDNVRSVGWEYSDIPADFVLGATTCALFLSLKYHRLHPEYIYTRINALGGRYGLRILLVMVDIDNHDDPLKELTKTSLINNVTILLSWSAQEAGRYLELYKSLEFAAPTSIKGIQATTYPDQLVDFVTVPRGINKTDAVSLVSNFGSVRTAINATPEEIALIGGWGDKKVQRWTDAVRKPFRTARASKRGPDPALASLSRDVSRLSDQGQNPTPNLSREQSRVLGETHQDPRVAARLGIGRPLPIDYDRATTGSGADPDKQSDVRLADDFLDEEEAFAELAAAESRLVQTSIAKTASSDTIQPGTAPHPVVAKRKPVREDEVTESMAAALDKLRKRS